MSSVEQLPVVCSDERVDGEQQGGAEGNKSLIEELRWAEDILEEVIKGVRERLEELSNRLERADVGGVMILKIESEQEFLDLREYLVRLVSSCFVMSEYRKTLEKYQTILDSEGEQDRQEVKEEENIDTLKGRFRKGVESFMGKVKNLLSGGSPSESA
jgi:predicted ribosome quality control (RQC) complex YloA/Tae2 family protein